MIDFKLELNESGRFDISIENKNIKTTNKLDTAITLSLFTDARASSSQILEPQNRRGWLNDLNNTYPMGGLLWLLDQRKLNQDTLNNGKDYTSKSLAWVTDKKMASSIGVVTNIVPRYGMSIDVSIQINQNELESKFFNLWELSG